jgi:hypothetical protein
MYGTMFFAGRGTSKLGVRYWTLTTGLAKHEPALRFWNCSLANESEQVFVAFAKKAPLEQRRIRPAATGGDWKFIRS